MQFFYYTNNGSSTGVGYFVWVCCMKSDSSIGCNVTKCGSLVSVNIFAGHICLCQYIKQPLSNAFEHKLDQLHE